MDRYDDAAQAFERMMAAVTPEFKGFADELQIAETYRFCCTRLMSGTRELPKDLLDREIARIGAEFGWSVDLVWEGLLSPSRPIQTQGSLW